MDWSGRPGEAPQDTASRLVEAMEVHERGDLEAAGRGYETILAGEPNHVAAAILLGVVRNQQADPAGAVEILTRALRLHPRSVQAHLNLGIALGQLERLEEALPHYRYALVLKPKDPEILRHMASAFQALQQPEEALVHWQHYLELSSDDATARLNCASVLQFLHRDEEALEQLEQALAISPNLADGLWHAGLLLMHLRRPAEALVHFNRLLALQPGRGELYLQQHWALRELRRPMEALASLERLLALQPDHVEALLEYGNLLVRHNRTDEAMACFDRLLSIQPDHVEALVSRGTTLHRLGQHQEALDSYDAALSIRPDHVSAHSNKIFVLDYMPEHGFEEHQRERGRYCESHALQFMAGVPPHLNDRDPERRLVLGYVSADFRRHSAATCFGPVLRHHDPGRFKVICYSGVAEEDDWTKGFQAGADVWRRTQEMSDEELAAQIRADGVDILIDLSGHSEGNRLLVFARKPAPVQVTAWGGGGGTGLPMIDYQFTDPISIPLVVRHLFAEACYDLPCCITFEAPEDAPTVGALPAARQGFTTFGCLNRTMKITPEAMDLWAEILRAVPGSRILLKDGLLDDGQVESRMRAMFSDRGVDPGRLLLRGRTSHRDHLATYGEVDIALDTFPQNGGTTTWEALWMGVPVMTLLGNKPASRISGAILHALELDQWVAKNAEEYVRHAVEMASNAGALDRIHRELRGRVLTSQAGNARSFTGAVEEAYRSMWKGWLTMSSPGADGGAST